MADLVIVALPAEMDEVAAALAPETAAVEPPTDATPAETAAELPAVEAAAVEPPTDATLAEKAAELPAAEAAVVALPTEAAPAETAAELPATEAAAVLEAAVVTLPTEAAPAETAAELPAVEAATVLEAVETIAVPPADAALLPEAIFEPNETLFTPLRATKRAFFPPAVLVSDTKAPFPIGFFAKVLLV